MRIEYKKSLKTIKKDIIQKQDILSNIKITHKHLSHLPLSKILEYFNISSILDLKIYTNIKIDTEDFEEEYQENIFSCLCTDRDNNPKELYLSLKEAKAEALRLSSYQQKLSIYPCRYSYGWHLTK